MYTTCSELVVFMYRSGESVNNVLSYCGLVDVRINASDKDLPVRYFPCSCEDCVTHTQVAPAGPH